MKIICKFCGQTYHTAELLCQHIESEHDIPVRRKGETDEQALSRFKAKNNRAGTSECQCPVCLSERNEFVVG